MNMCLAGTVAPSTDLPSRLHCDMPEHVSILEKGLYMQCVRVLSLLAEWFHSSGQAG